MMKREDVMDLLQNRPIEAILDFSEQYGYEEWYKLCDVLDWVANNI